MDDNDDLRVAEINRILESELDGTADKPKRERDPERGDSAFKFTPPNPRRIRGDHFKIDTPDALLRELEDNRMYREAVRDAVNKRQYNTAIPFAPRDIGDTARFAKSGTGMVRHAKNLSAADQKKADKQKQEAAARKELAKAAKKARETQFAPDVYGSVTLPIPRYTQAGQDLFGLTRKSATQPQLAMRDYYKFTGDGAYNRGGFDGSGSYTSNGGAVVMHPNGRFSGEGGFFDDVGNFIRTNVLPVAKDVIRVAAPVIGEAIMPMGGGQFASNVANRFLGEGAYTVDENGEPIIKYNNLINHGSMQTKSSAMIESAGDETGDLIFTHNEYIHDLTSKSNDFHTLERFEINPGVYQSFPLLSQFAQHFEEYDFTQCIFEFKSLVTEGNATAAGSVMLAPNYNASNPNLPDKRSIENSTGSVSGKVTASLFCGVECANDKTAYGGIKYVRTVDIDAAGRRMYDLGFMQIAAAGVPAGLAVGELWCRYKVRLSKMKVGALKVVPISGGLALLMTPPSVPHVVDNAYFMNQVADFVSKPSAKANVQNGQLIANDEFTQISLTKEESDTTWTRVFRAEVGVIGASQYDVIMQYSNYHDLPTNPPDLFSTVNMDGTTCTIPYTTAHTWSLYNATGTGQSNVTTWTHKFSIVFGTPGQIGKMNIQLNVPAVKSIYIGNDRVVSCTVAVRRNA